MRVLIVKHKPLTSTETFIRLHRAALNADLYAECVPTKPLPTAAYSTYCTLLRERSPDVILAEYAKAGVLMMRAAESLGIPLVVHFHGVDAYHEAVLGTFGRHYGELFSIADSIVSVSQHMTHQLAMLGAPARKIITIPCGVDDGWFHVSRTTPATPVVLTVGRLESTKGTLESIRVFSQVRNKHDSAILRIVGCGSLLTNAQALVQELDLEKAVRFVGSVSHATVRAEMSAASVLLHCAQVTEKGDMEGTPVALLEAAAVGLPIVSTKVGGIVEAVIDGVTGLLCDADNLPSTANALCGLIEDETLARNLGANGKKHVFSNYLASHQCALLSSVLASAILMNTGRLAS
ncbi:glycosyltransferase [Achromobacter arsenitoxydans]|uniref:glycosyltransferase n=1 Tax=Achromobacter arsenitoxydans TaxID=1147684 RepID=UPI0009DACD99|nr:glycosyltransferase [Achromobacter arsenitoxydans]